VDEVSPALEGSGVEGGWAPEDLRSAYKLPSTTAGSGQTVAVVDAYDDPNAESDLAVYRSQYGLGECTTADGCFRKVNQTGGTSYPAPERGWAKEISLDLDMVSAVCPKCHIRLVEANNAYSSNLAAAEDEAAALGATEISNSFGIDEPSEPPEYAQAYDHAGVSITAASGDEGYGAQSPASNPNVIAVGGTTLGRAGIIHGYERVWSESVWYHLNEEGIYTGTGSGCSLEPKPTWQTDTGCAYRTNNDVAAVADPNTPVSVYDSYETEYHWRLPGGTSVATPIIAATMALADSYTRSLPGASAFYDQVAAGGPGKVNDITRGENDVNGCTPSYLCTAGVGYDGPSGLGTPSGAPEVKSPYVTAFGSAGFGEVQFSHPSGDAVQASNGDVWVVDSGNDRVEKLTGAGAFVGAYGKAGSNKT
jgi:subtilase family serine protease